MMHPRVAEVEPLLYVGDIDKRLAENNGIIMTNGPLPNPQLLAEHGILSTTVENAIRKVYKIPQDRPVRVVYGRHPSPRLHYYDEDNMIIYIMEKVIPSSDGIHYGLNAQANL